jgi:beta-glucosidase
VYLPPFRAMLSAGAVSVMAAFNTINGVPATGNEFLLRRILRGEWGFDGMVVSDYTAIPEMVAHGYAASPGDAAREALGAGIDMEMVSTTYHDHLKELIDNHRIPMQSVDAAVRNVLRLKFRLGLFDQPVPVARQAVITAEARGLAQQLAAESAVLLKNENHLLPLAQSIRSVAVIGPLADSPVDQMGSWAMDGRPEDVMTPLSALRQTLGNTRVLYAPGLKTSRAIDRNGFAAALDAARRADVVLLFLGEEQILSGEARSRAFINLPGAQEDLVSEVGKAGKPMVVIIQAGRPLTFQKVAAQARAVLYAWHPGTMGGPAIADLLFGRAVPSGKLPVTFPRTVGQVPIYYAHLNTGRPASPAELGIPMGNPVNPEGYTSRYIDVDLTPEYPFGYGLSYTDFVYSQLRLSAQTLMKDGTLSVSADLTNRGKYGGAELVQLYIHCVTASVAQPIRVLKGFRRVQIQPGETKSVTFVLTAADLAHHNQQMQLVAEPGPYQVWIAPDSTRGVQGEFTLK